MKPKQVKAYHALWKSLHLVSYSLTSKKERDGFEQVVEGLSSCIPCDLCREHLSEHLRRKRMPTDPDRVADWVVDLHNSVNSRNGKALWTPERARKVYEMDSACTDVAKKKTVPMYVTVTMGLVLTACIIYMCVQGCSGNACEI